MFGGTNMLEKELKKDVKIEMELIDTHKCRFMGDVNTYDITLVEKDFKYTKSILNKPFFGSHILPFDKEGNIFLEIQYRFPIQETIIELPAGRAEPGEDFFECAKRELREETGCTAEEIIKISEIFAQPEFTSEELGGFVAVGCEKTEEQDLDNDESVCVIKIPFDVAIELVKRNIITDERTIIAIGESRYILGYEISNNSSNVEQIIEEIKNRVKEEEKNLIEKDVGIDYTETCEFGVIRDHIVKVPGNKNSRRECLYVKAGDMVLPISKSGKLGVVVRYMPAVGKNLVQLPSKMEFEKDTEFQDFGEMVTAVGYSNDRQYMFLAKDLEENDEFIWLTKEQVIECIKDGKIKDGRVLAMILKYLL